MRAENQTSVPRRIALGPATSRMMWDTLLKWGFNRLMQCLWPETQKTVLQTIPRDKWYSVRTPSIFFSVDSSCNAHGIAVMNTHCAQSLSSSFRHTRPKSSEVCHSFIILPAIYLIVYVNVNSGADPHRVYALSFGMHLWCWWNRHCEATTSRPDLFAILCAANIKLFADYCVASKA